MNVPVIVGGMLAAVALAVGWPGARGAARTTGWALATVPAVMGLVASGAVMASLVTRTSVLVWLVVATVAGWSVLVARRGLDDHLFHPDDPGVRVLVAAGLVALVPVVLVDLPPVESDARFIWWFHAAWFRGGGGVASEALANPSFGPTHPGYPPLLPGVIASVWHVGGAYDREVALRTSQLVTAMCITSAAFFVTSVLRLARPVTGAVLVVGVCWGANAGVGLSGFADLAWAAAMVAAAVLLLAGPTDRRTVLVGALFAAAAALFKLEAGVAALLLTGLTVLRSGRAWRRSLPVVVAVGLAVASWAAVGALADVSAEDRGQWSQLPDVLDGDSEVHRRMVATVGHLADELGLLVLGGAVAVVAMVALGRSAGARLRQPGLLSLLALSAGYLAFLAAVVSVAPLPLSEYTDSGNYRTVMVVRLLVVVDVVLAAVASVRALRGAPGSEVPAARCSVSSADSLGARAR